ncbi:hypothetical protein F511_40108 [Dorcoceras hygrometricum]|uniref:Uncharacterized protein n=1 Tax=Dorcoceras hygrometricum TaxID=472368 RepID=A0A2Z7CL95_9LAMI|nr:hypothetical protein F511_40108 [Dorcoceras hygrometricum]
MVSGPELFRCQRWSTVMCRPVRFGDFRCDQDLRSIRGICCENGLRCYIVLIGLFIDTSLETGIAGFEEHEVFAMFVCLRDCGPVVPLFFNSFGFELILRYLDRFEQVVASVEFAVNLLGQ